MTILKMDSDNLIEIVEVMNIRNNDTDVIIFNDNPELRKCAVIVEINTLEADLTVEITKSEFWGFLEVLEKHNAFPNLECDVETISKENKRHILRKIGTH